MWSKQEGRKIIVSLYTCQSECWTECLGLALVLTTLSQVSTIGGKRRFLPVSRRLAEWVLLIEGDRLVSEFMRSVWRWWSLVRMVCRRPPSTVTICSARSTNCGMWIAVIVASITTACGVVERWCGNTRSIARITMRRMRFVGKSILLLFFHARNVA
jgi:hypothetical protein